MSLFSPFRDASRGLRVYLRGIQWLKAHPRYLVLLAAPSLVGLLFLVGGLSLFSANDEKVMGWILFTQPEAGLMSLVYYACKILLYLALTVLTLVFSLLLMNILMSPVYEVISAAVERDVTGVAPPAVGFLGSVRVMFVELKKVVFIFGVSILLLLIPGLNVLSTLVCAFLVGWDFFDYPLARRGWTFGQRFRLVSRNFWAVTGLGLWLVIPFAQIIMLPLAVAGGTLLNLEALKRDQLLTPYVPREDA